MTTDKLYRATFQKGDQSLVALDFAAENRELAQAHADHVARAGAEQLTVVRVMALAARRANELGVFHTDGTADVAAYQHYEAKRDECARIGHEWQGPYCKHCGCAKQGRASHTRKAAR